MDPSNSITFEVTNENHGAKFYIKNKLTGQQIGLCEVATYSGASAYIKNIDNRKLLSKTIHISWLDINDDYQSNYFGTKLLYYVFRYYYQRGYRYVTLYDGSARSGKPDSIYRSVGLTYIRNSNGIDSMDMIGNLRHILHGKFLGRNGKNTNPNKFFREKWIESKSGN